MKASPVRTGQPVLRAEALGAALPPLAAAVSRPADAQTPNEPTEAVEVRLSVPARFTDQEVVVAGRMALSGSSDEGLFYSLSHASFATSSHS